MKIEAHRPEQPIVVTMKFENLSELKDLLSGFRKGVWSGGPPVIIAQFLSELEDILEDDY